MYERYTKFDRYAKKNQDKVEDFISEFEKYLTELSKNRWNYLKFLSY